MHHFAAITHFDSTETLTTELKALAAQGSFSRRAWVNLWDVREQPSVPVAADGARVRAGVESETPRRIRARDGRFRRHRFRVDRRDARRARPSAEARSVVLRRRIRRHSVAPAADFRRRISRRRSNDPVRCLVVPGTVAACLAAGRSVRACRAWRSRSAIGIFADGLLLYARDLDWGYAAPSASTGAAQDREALANRLSTELRWSFLYLKQYWEQDVSQVLLCGDMPEVRSLTAPLIERLNIEVETLDTLEGIDTAKLPEGFAERASTLRLASSIAVEPPPVNLLPVEVTASRTSRVGTARRCSRHRGRGCARCVSLRTSRRRRESAPSRSSKSCGARCHRCRLGRTGGDARAVPKPSASSGRRCSRSMPKGLRWRACSRPWRTQPRRVSR